MALLRAPLPAGPLDVVGDVHGEIDALLRVLHRLGCDPERATAARPLVFLGDLVDRGPDSPAVVEVVMRLVEAGIAHAVLGNHELNLLAAEHKEGNGWFWGEADDHFHVRPKPLAPAERHPFPSRHASPAQRARFLSFFRTLPITLERADLRVVHACWHEPSLDALPTSADVAALARSHARGIADDLRARGVSQRAAEERAAWSQLRLPDHQPDTFLHAVAEEDEREQLGNPVKVLLSGLEERVAADRVFYAGGKWRFVRRVDWWRDHRGPPVVVGHYWRRRPHDPRRADDVFGPHPQRWAGPDGGVFCADFSVGERFKERATGRRDDYLGGLAAMRWPERTLVFDDRQQHLDTEGFGG